jgi:hypothetical protein
VISEMVGTDFMELQKQLFRDDRVMELYSRMLPDRLLNNAA